MLNTKKIAIAVFILVPMLAFVSHLVITRPMETALLFYPLEGFWAKQQQSCTANAPEWMKDLLIFSVEERKSLANQIAYRDLQGVLHHCENGWADKLLGDVPVNAHHRFRFASITKVMTADLILQLIDEGKISLNTRLVELFPEIEPQRDERINDITIGHLLDHSAGFDRTGPEGDIMFFSAKKNWCPDQLQGLAKERLHFAPGEKQVYSNLGYCLLGAVIEKVTQMPYRDYAEKVEGLSELSLRFVDDTYFPDEVSYDFRFDIQYGENYPQQYNLRALSSAAGLSGSASSLVKLIEKMLMRPGRLAPPVTERCGEKMSTECYGFAFNHVQQKNSLALFLHSGYIPGSSSNLVVDSQGGILVILSANSVTYEQNEKTILKISDSLSNFYLKESQASRN
jgi:D-alanyl-D-alanine carboxypeptidase